jgi:predicted CXXCH cytochrome family protein
VGNYPHPGWNAPSRRDATIDLNITCARCHIAQAERAQDSVHGAALDSGNKNAAVCTDCHTAHAVRQLTDPGTGELRSESHVLIPQICAQCHNAIYEKYKASVHGAALLNENNQDVPTCIDCHGVHNIEDPTTSFFRLRSPQLCAGCHTDIKIMGKYGISTDVLDTYVADFHGTTVSVFEKQSPDAEVNKAVCYDCHGIHDITRVDDPVSGILIKENLLVRCKLCHPDATSNFPSAWLSHYTPSPENNQFVYFVDLFYKLFIPAVLGGMGMLVARDVGHTLWKKIQKRKPAPLPLTLEHQLPEESQND